MSSSPRSEERHSSSLTYKAEMAGENCYDAVTLMDDEHDVTLLLKAWSDGEQAALDRLAPLETPESAGAGRASIGPGRRTSTTFHCRFRSHFPPYPMDRPEQEHTEMIRIHNGYCRRFVLVIAIAVALSVVTGCGAIRKSAVKSVADTLAAPDSDVFARDEDLELVGAAAPFGLKLYESLLESIPDHVPLLIATCSNFTQYSYAFIQPKAEELEYKDYSEYRRQQDRALRMYLRARDYCMRGLEKRFPKIRVALLRDPKTALAKAKKSDVPLLYWSAAAWGAAISLGIGRADLAGDLHVVRGLAERALALDPDYANGATHELMISLESLDELVGGSETRAREHFKRAVDLQSSQPQAGPYVSLAMGIALKKQNREEFEQLLKAALAIDADKHPTVRLVNLAAQRRAQFLLNQIDELFPK